MLRNTVKLIVAGLLVLVLLAIPLVSACTKPASEPAQTMSKEGWPKTVVWGGSDTAATLTILGVGMSRMIQKYTGITATCEPLGGGLTNLLALQKKEIEFTGINSIDLYNAPRGLGEHKQTGPITNLCALFTMNALLYTGVVRDEDKIYTIEDWRGKKVMCNNPKTIGALDFTKDIFASHGMTIDDIKVQHLPGSADRIIAMVEATTDVLVAPYSKTTAWVTEMFQKRALRFISLDPAKLDDMIKRTPFYYPAILPAGSYKGQNKDVLTAGKGQYAACRADLPDSFVYEAMKAIWGHFDDELKPMNPSFEEFDKREIFTQFHTPMHPGAIKYWKEQGLWDATAQKRQDTILKELGRTR